MIICTLSFFRHGNRLRTFLDISFLCQFLLFARHAFAFLIDISAGTGLLAATRRLCLAVASSGFERTH